MSDTETTKALIERVLADHGDPLFFHAKGGWGWLCDCEQKDQAEGRSTTAERTHRAHIAAAITQALAKEAR